VFDARTGTTLEVDLEAMDLLLSIREQGVVREDDIVADPGRPRLCQRSRDRCVKVVRQLLELGVLTLPSPSDLAVHRSRRFAEQAKHSPYAPSWPVGSESCAPETVHWAITYRCEAQCADCYARRHAGRFVQDIETRDALRVIDLLAQWGVFQLAIGGGEPLERPDLTMIAQHARACGLVVHVTTGRHHVPYSVLERIANGVTVLQFGIRHEALLRGGASESASLAGSVGRAQSLGLHVGANLMLSNTVLANFERLIAMLARAGLRRITLLRYKPPAEPARWTREDPAPETMRRFERVLAEAARRHPEIAFRIDCAASFLQRRLPRHAACSRGIRGCVAANRILALAPDGSIFPCSQLAEPHLRAGNILTDDLDAIWMESAVMKRYRLFREGRAFRESECGACRAHGLCGGCRAFARDVWGAEPRCPVSACAQGESDERRRRP